MQATDISAQEMELDLGGRMISVRFDHNQMRYAELYWQHTTRGKLGYMGIADQLIHRTYLGMGAVAYGAVAAAALASGSRPISMDRFDKEFDYGTLLGASRTLTDCALAALPGKGGGEKKAESPA